jgi:hypothetical protein|tara:strand:+ start:175 stop:555 length:381 start_codon:yes stop_codon:yes gene_type:complete
MAHFAEIDGSNIVTRVIVVADEHEADGENWCNGFLSGTWKQTSYNTRGGKHYAPNSSTEDSGTPFRKNYAAIGFTYDATRDAFIPPKFFASWVIDESTCQWKAPVDIPGATDEYYWDETSTSWKQE